MSNYLRRAASLATTGLLFACGVAFAPAAHAVTYTLTVNPTAPLREYIPTLHRNIAHVSGTASCTGGLPADVAVALSQDGADGEEISGGGSVFIACDGRPHTWAVDIQGAVDLAGLPLLRNWNPGPATVEANMGGTLGTTFHGTITLTTG
ncbi:hypothetical protein [Streptomyces sp. NBC_01276]|uniref:hypothetical protein n=1 Tax=Streptomyces sp. NBC_01276 TaxID=2903808 RepID=UPI00352F6845